MTTQKTPGKREVVAVCGCCGGHLPAADRRGDNLRSGGECPGSVTVDRTGRVLGCGAWTAAAYRA